jgi:hypothetical protein
MPMELARREPLSRLAARFFVGLNVAPGVAPCARRIFTTALTTSCSVHLVSVPSILSQLGIYEDQQRRIINEPSVQIIIIDFDGIEQDAFTKEMIALGEQLARELEQETVLLEIQKRGVVEDQYTLTPD